jgi:hypothetical protein
MRKRKRSIAENPPLPRERKPRPIGLAKNKIKIFKKFFNPLLANLLNAFEGKP